MAKHTDTSAAALARSTQNLRTGGHRAHFITPADAAGLNTIVEQVSADRETLETAWHALNDLLVANGLPTTDLDAALDAADAVLTERRRAAYATHREYFPHAVKS